MLCDQTVRTGSGQSKMAASIFVKSEHFYWYTNSVYNNELARLCWITKSYSLPEYLETHVTSSVRPLMLKCLPLNLLHCNSRKSMEVAGQSCVTITSRTNEDGGKYSQRMPIATFVLRDVTLRHTIQVIYVLMVCTVTRQQRVIT